MSCGMSIQQCLILNSDQLGVSGLTSTTEHASFTKALDSLTSKGKVSLWSSENTGTGRGQRSFKNWNEESFIGADG